MREKPFFEVMPAEGGVSNYAFPVPWPGRRDHCSIKVSMVAVLTLRTILKITMTMMKIMITMTMAPRCRAPQLLWRVVWTLRPRSLRCSISSLQFQSKKFCNVIRKTSLNIWRWQMCVIGVWHWWRCIFQKPLLPPHGQVVSRISLLTHSSPEGVLRRKKGSYVKARESPYRGKCTSDHWN